MTASTKDGRALELARDDAHSRYTGSVKGRLAAFAEFDPAGRLVVFTHTENDPAFEGQGAASQLPPRARRAEGRDSPRTSYAGLWTTRVPADSTSSRRARSSRATSPSTRTSTGT